MKLEGMYLGKRDMKTKKGTDMEIADIYTEEGMVRVMARPGTFSGIEKFKILKVPVAINSLVFAEGQPVTVTK